MSCVIEPMVVRNNAWLLYLYTPSDKPKLTHGDELYLKYHDSPEVFCQIRTIEDTTGHQGKPLVDKSKLDSVDMTHEEHRREFYCDFAAYRYKRADQGVTFVKQLRLAESSHMIQPIRFILNGIWGLLTIHNLVCPRKKYGRNVLPHDMSRRQMPTLDTRLQQANEIAEQVGFLPFAIGRKYLREEMITKARTLLGKSFLLP